jgi:hypothetical protein
LPLARDRVPWDGVSADEATVLSGKAGKINVPRLAS